MNKEEYTIFINQTTTSTDIDNIIKNYVITNLKEDHTPCDFCSNNPKNGGSGICNCILGTIQATC